MRKFINEDYHLNNMGMIAAVDNNVAINDFLKKISGILSRIEPDARAGEDPTIKEDDLPPGRPGPQGEIEIAEFPNQNPDEPGLLLYAWPPARDLNADEEFLLNLLLDNIAGGPTSDLYQKFIDSETRIMDLGANSVFAWFDTYPGYPVYLGFNNVKTDFMNKEKINSIRTLILDEFAKVSGFKDKSAELGDFNERAKNKVIQRRRDIRKFLNTPPRFGYRGTGSEWFYHLRHLQKIGGFEKNLALLGELDFADSLLSAGSNFWTDYIDKWGLLKTVPFGVGSRANPEIASTAERELQQRLDSFTSSLKNKYGIDDDEMARRKYKEEYDAKTAVIEEEAAKIPMPEFTDNPPLTLDNSLEYDVEKLPGGGPLVTSTFESLTGATSGLAFNMYAVPESLLVYVPALPTLMTDVGVIKDGKPIPYDDMIEMIRKEILGLDVYYSVNNRTERVELVVRGSGSDKNESLKSIDWMSTVIFSPDWREENLARIRDAVDLSIKGLRNTMKMSEEAWVNDPANAYWKQDNRLILSANSFLTRIHSLHRLRWMLKNADAEKTIREFSDFMSLAAGLATNLNREQLSDMLNSLDNLDHTSAGLSRMENLKSELGGLSPEARELVIGALDDLGANLPDIPDNSLAEDWKYLCREMTEDLKIKPSQALDEIKYLSDLLFRQSNVRGFLISGSVERKDHLGQLNRLVDKLDRRAAEYYSYNQDPLIISRLDERSGESTRPVYVGLVNENTRLGVHINSSDCVSYFDTDRGKLLKFLSARLYGGGGAHSMFMKTWGAGLAYSNGLRSNENTGRLIYYAERCPDLTQTMQFVVNELKNASYDPALAEYAVAQAFEGDRAGGRYESRGEAMAADLADGLTPEVVARFRQNILDLRSTENLYDQLHSMMIDTYGEVLPGLGPQAKDVPGAIYFIIGPEKQFRSYENYIRGVEGEIKIQRLYPRDYWIIRKFDTNLPQ
jgi:Zn-dependent M16 (insulinase) family peptidase